MYIVYNKSSHSISFFFKQKIGKKKYLHFSCQINYSIKKCYCCTIHEIALCGDPGLTIASTACMHTCVLQRVYSLRNLVASNSIIFVYILTDRIHLFYTILEIVFSYGRGSIFSRLRSIHFMAL